MTYFCSHRLPFSELVIDMSEVRQFSKSGLDGAIDGGFAWFLEKRNTWHFLGVNNAEKRIEVYLANFSQVPSAAFKLLHTMSFSEFFICNETESSRMLGLGGK